ncbi:MAG TPA: histidine--tRNA ligase [Planctomycetota bacterium]|nr:histidine--tRNA ligase [Planctomycetota bacterium]
MSKIKPQVLRGFRDYLPAKMIPRQKMLWGIEQVFQSFGFVPLMTPALEYLDILTGKYGEEGETLLYRFKDQGDRDVALRYDLTVPLARVVAQYPEITLPFRRYQIAPVWRAEKPARGRFREFVQCDGDIVGSPDMAADAELVQLACELLERLGVKDFVVRINNRKVLAGLMGALGILEGPGENAVLRTIDKLPKIGRDETSKLLREENGLGPSQVDRVFDFLSIDGSTKEVLDRLGQTFEEGSAGRKGRDELAELFSILEAVGRGGAAAIDLSIARGLAYYTGTIYETFLTGLPGYGAVMGGGRYDKLIGVFKEEEIPAVGISLGIDRLLEGLVELKVLEEVATVADVLVSTFGPDTAGYSARIAQLLRSAGIRCELFPGYAKIGKQFRHAERNRRRWVVIAGTNEEARDEVAVKDLSDGKQETVPLDGLVARLRAIGAT